MHAYIWNMMICGKFSKAFVITPNAPADFENPFHIRLFRQAELVSVLERSFDDVWVGGIDAVPHVKEDFRLRREKAKKVLKLVDALEESDDVQNVYANFDFSEGVSSALDEDED